MKHAVLTLLISAVIIGLVLALSQPWAEEEGVPIGGAFTLVDDSGRTVTERDFRGRYTLVFFGFTNCPDVCPTTLMTLTELMEEVDPQGRRITPLFISVDTADTPETMHAYLEDFHPSIVGLTGDAEQIRRVTGAYKVYYARQELPDAALGYTMDHSSFLFFMGQDGRYIAHFSYGDPVGKIAQRITSEMEKRS